jgi:hypothetical protein
LYNFTNTDQNFWSLYHAPALSTTGLDSPSQKLYSKLQALPGFDPCPKYPF